MCVSATGGSVAQSAAAIWSRKSHLLEGGAVAEVMVAEDQEAASRTVPQPRDEGVVLERGRVRHVADAYDGVAGSDVVGPGLEHAAFHRAQARERSARRLERPPVPEVEVGPDPRLGRGRLDAPDRPSPHQPRELVLGPGDAGHPRREAGTAAGGLPTALRCLRLRPASWSSHEPGSVNPPRSRSGRLGLHSDPPSWHERQGAGWWPSTRRGPTAMIRSHRLIAPTLRHRSPRWSRPAAAGPRAGARPGWPREGRPRRARIAKPLRDVVEALMP